MTFNEQSPDPVSHGRGAIPAPAPLPPFEPPASQTSLTVASGARPLVDTIIYVHGIGNKPTESILKCQWDHALFGVDLGDRSRMSYWVNREYYPKPSSETCLSPDTVSMNDDEASTAAIQAISGLDPHDTWELINKEVDSLARDDYQRSWLLALAEQIMLPRRWSRGDDLTDVRDDAESLRHALRDLMTRDVTRALLRDVNAYLFRKTRQTIIEHSLLDRVKTGGGPFVVIAHSLGVPIAWNVLRQLTAKQCDVKLFVTMGSPLGIPHLNDALSDWGALEKPGCVERWLDVADELDPVAFTAHPRKIDSIDRVVVQNPDSPANPHSATGYLRTKEVQLAVRDIVSRAFTQPVGRFVIAGDLVRKIEDGLTDERHSTLIQLTSISRRPNSDDPDLEGSRNHLIDVIIGMIRDSRPEITDAEAMQLARIDPLRRFVSASLTRTEIEHLRTRFTELKIDRVWRNGVKRTMVYASTNTLQARPANTAYGATGRNIGWAVLDSGIRADHPHFAKYNNVVAQWCCTCLGQPVSVVDDAVACEDRDGHGTHVAGIIAGEFDEALVVDAATQAKATFAGMAPETRLHSYKVIGDDGTGSDASIIKALDHIASLNEQSGQLVIHGVNLSLGGAVDPEIYNCGHTPLCQELRRLWMQGVLVCLAAGNEGFAMLQSDAGELAANMDLSIGDPANLQEAISVGSIHKSNPHTYGVSYFSSRGPTADGRRKPDLVAPGEQILSAWHNWRAGTAHSVDNLYVEMSGTSMAAPHVSGLLAAFLSLRREFIGYPDRVKRILLDNCTDLDRDRSIQGYGMPNLVRMLLAS